MAPRTVVRSERYDVPQQFIELAQRRTEFLFRHIQFGDMPMRNVIASAYLQGMSDCADALEARGRISAVAPANPTEDVGGRQDG
jgi:hypothetical protein